MLCSARALSKLFQKGRRICGCKLDFANGWHDDQLVVITAPFQIQRETSAYFKRRHFFPKSPFTAVDSFVQLLWDFVGGNSNHLHIQILLVLGQVVKWPQLTVNLRENVIAKRLSVGRKCQPPCRVIWSLLARAYSAVRKEIDGVDNKSRHPTKLWSLLMNSCSLVTPKSEKISTTWPTSNGSSRTHSAFSGDRFPP